MVAVALIRWCLWQRQEAVRLQMPLRAEAAEFSGDQMRGGGSLAGAARSKDGQDGFLSRGEVRLSLPGQQMPVEEAGVGDSLTI